MAISSAVLNEDEAGGSGIAMAGVDIRGLPPASCQAYNSLASTSGAE